MTITLRPLALSELDTASALCLRSKAYWGYDEAFMEACVPILTLTKTNLENDRIIIADIDGKMAGIAHVLLEEEVCYLDKLFVDPAYIGKGVGKALFNWTVTAAKDLGAPDMMIHADPDAAPFYQRMGCIRDGDIESEAIPGRYLPRFTYKLALA